jgi:hypothetical protein
MNKRIKYFQETTFVAVVGCHEYVARQEWETLEFLSNYVK